MENNGTISALLQGKVLQTLLHAKVALGLEAERLKLVAAVSGGADSHSLLHVLTRIGIDLDLTVAHINHHLRLDSDADEEFVRRIARGYGIPCLFYQAGPCAPGRNVEDWAREVRYQFLNDARINTESHLVATAHQQDDQAETIFMRLLDGRILSSSYAASELDMKRRIIRPMLGVSRELVLAYVQDQGLEFVVDCSNKDLSRSRNRLRHEVFPRLKQEFNPGLIQTLSDVAARLADDENELWAKASMLLGQRPAWSCREVAELSSALGWRVLKLLAAREIGNDAGKLGYYGLKRSEALAKAGKGKLELGFGIELSVEKNGMLKFSLREAALAELTEERLVVPGKIGLSDARLNGVSIEAKVHNVDRATAMQQIERLRNMISEGTDGGTAFFDLALLSPEQLHVRGWKNGDQIAVFKRGRRKLKKLFQERSIAERLRRQTPIVEEGERILWVPGVARSKHALISNETRQILELSYILGI